MRPDAPTSMKSADKSSPTRAGAARTSGSSSCSSSARISPKSAVEQSLQLADEALRGRAFVAGLGLAELLEQLALSRAQPGRGFDLDLDHHVAMPAPVQHRH